MSQRFASSATKISVAWTLGKPVTQIQEKKYQRPWGDQKSVVSTKEKKIQSGNVECVPMRNKCSPNYLDIFEKD